MTDATRSNAAFGLAAIALAACSSPTGERPTAPAQPAEKAAIKAQLDAAYRPPSPDASVEALTDERLRFFTAAPSVVPPNAPAHIGRAAVTEFYRSIFEQGFTVLDNRYANLTVEVHGNVAIRRYLGTGRFVLGDGSEPLTAKNRYMDVMVKENGEWKIAVHAWRSAP